MKLKTFALLWLALTAVVSLAAVGCGAFSRTRAHWAKQADGSTVVLYQLVKSGSVQDIELMPQEVAPMSEASESAWREAIGKWNEAGGAVQLVEVDYLQPHGDAPGVLIYDLEGLQEGREGEFDWYAPDGPVLRARAYCAPIGENSNVRFGRYFRLHEIGHALLLPHSAIPTAVMWPWRVELLGAPSVDLTPTDRRDLAKRYPP